MGQTDVGYLDRQSMTLNIVTNSMKDKHKILWDRTGSGPLVIAGAGAEVSLDRCICQFYRSRKEGTSPAGRIACVRLRLGKGCDRRQKPKEVQVVSEGGRLRNDEAAGGGWRPRKKLFIFFFFSHSLLLLLLLFFMPIMEPNMGLELATLRSGPEMRSRAEHLAA